MAFVQRKSLAGTCGIPRESERIYVDVDYELVGGILAGEELRPLRIHWPDGRYWNVESVYDKREFGREFFGNLCIRWALCVARQRRELWWEHGGFFVARRSGLAG